MSVPGKLIRAAGKIVGNTVEYGMKFTGELVAYIAESNGKEKVARRSRTIGKFTGSVLGGTTRVTSRILGDAVDKFVDAGSEGIKYVSENAVRTETRIYGEAENFYDASVYVDAEYKVE
jgi:hypothetical protein